MVSAVSSQTFANKKPKLLGADTHAANLTGSSSQTNDSGLDGSFSEVVEPFPVGSSNIGSTESVLKTVSGISITSSTNKVIINVIVQCSTDNTAVTFRVRDTDILGTILTSFVVNTASNSAGNYHVLVTPHHSVADDISTGVSTFVLTRQGSSTSFFRNLGFQLNVDVVNLDDTHAANLTGSNTQDTKNTNIIGA